MQEFQVVSQTHHKNKKQKTKNPSGFFLCVKVAKSGHISNKFENSDILFLSQKQLKSTTKLNNVPQD